VTGRVKIVTSRGFGFIETRIQIDFFFHYTQWDGNWKDLLLRYVNGEKIYVEFENNRESKSGPQALRVREIPEEGLREREAI
jgi:cold shock CspA family protein